MPSVSIPAALASAASLFTGTAATVGAGAAAASTAAFGTSAAVAGTATGAAALAGLETASIAATTVPAWLSAVGTASSALGGVVGTYGAIKTGEAQAASAKYNATIEARNSKMATQNAALAGQAGYQQAGNQGLKNRAEMGSIRANQGASGVDMNSSSSVDVRTSSADLGELDALTIRSNAVKEAYGYVTQSANYETQSNLDKIEASNDSTAGIINAGSTLLGAASDTASNYHKYKMAGGLSF